MGAPCVVRVLRVSAMASRSPVPLWVALVAGGLAVVGLLAFFLTRDPMLMFFFVMTAAVVLLVGQLATRAMRGRR